MATSRDYNMWIEVEHLRERVRELEGQVESLKNQHNKLQAYIVVLEEVREAGKGILAANDDRELAWAPAIGRLMKALKQCDEQTNAESC